MHADRRYVSAPPAATSVDVRLAEIAEVLAAGLQRLLARKSSRKSAGYGESSLDFVPALAAGCAASGEGTTHRRLSTAYELSYAREV
jgi:hypothetical protein